jgi:hypothetical protein
MLLCPSRSRSLPVDVDVQFCPKRQSPTRLYMYLYCSPLMKASPTEILPVFSRSTRPCLPQSQCPIIYIIDMSSISYLRRSPSTGSEPETESTTDFPSTSESSYNPSETSSGRDFVVSDTETLSRRSFSDYSAENGINDYADDISIESVNFALSPMKPHRADLGQPHIHRFRPVKVLAKRSANRNGRAATQYLVLWCSWEDTDRIAERYVRGVPTVQSRG